MKKLAAGVFLETKYSGVNLGLIKYSRGLLLIDTPLLPEEGLTWLSSFKALKPGPELFLVNLDAHPDRVLGNHLVEGTILTQSLNAEVFKRRPSVFKTQNTETGAEWENYTGLTGIRLQASDLVFSDQIKIKGNDLEIIIEHHPGPEKGASWVIIPKAKVVFIGDAVVLKQPPFFANANLAAWIENLDLLLSTYKEYKIVSSRSGLINEKQIRSMRKMIVDLNKKMERLGKRKASPEETKKLISKILANSEAPAKYKTFYSQRLEYGLYHYYANNYFPNKSDK